MSKKYWTGDYDINTDWGGDISTSGLPLTGKAVQTVIKDELSKLNKGKVGYIVEDNGKVYFSSSKEEYNNGITMGSVLSKQKYAISLELDINNRYTFLSSDSEKNIIWYFKTVELENNNDVYEENVSVEYYIENTTDGTEKTVPTSILCKPNSLLSGYTEVLMNLNEYLTNGVSTIKISIKGLNTKEEREKNLTVTIVTLDIEDDTDFSKPFEKNFIATTNINCTRGQVFHYEYRIDGKGDFIYDSKSYEGEGRVLPYTYAIDISNLEDGLHVFEYNLFINIGGESTYSTAVQRIEFVKGKDYVFDEPQILFLTSYLKGEKIFNEDGNLIVNGVTQYIPHKLKYCVFSSKYPSVKMEFYDITDSDDVLPITDTTEKGSFSYYSIQSTEQGTRKIKAICKDIDGYVLNDGGRIFYVEIKESTLKISEFTQNMRIDFSSVGKNNREKWECNISNNYATFSETFDWSQGWTENGLVVSEGCGVYFDYIPFPKQKDNPTAEEANEYVGGHKGYTFEIEFMTQNVTDESAILCNMSNEVGSSKCGLLITGSEIKFTAPNGGESVSSRFKEGEMNRATIVIRPNGTEDSFKGLIELYMNGVITSIAKYSYKDKFVVTERDIQGNEISKNLKFVGTQGADLVVKYIRAYNGTMSSDNVIDNYIIYRDNADEMLTLYNKNDVLNTQKVITPNSLLEYGEIPILIFVGRTVEGELASGDGNEDENEPYQNGTINANEKNWYKTLEDTNDKKEKVDMDVIYYNPKDKSKNFKFVKAYITPQGTSSMYYPKKNYRIYTQKNSDTRMFLSKNSKEVLELDQMLKSNFGEHEKDRVFEVFRGSKNKKNRLYSFKDNAQAVKCWCLKADFAETSSSHNTGIARLWGDTMRNAAVTIEKDEHQVFKTRAQSTIEKKHNNNINKDMPDIRTTIDGFPIVVFGKKSYADEYVFLGKYNFNNDKSTESVFGFCDIDTEESITSNTYDYENNVAGVLKHSIDAQLDKYMSCVETLDNGNALANFAEIDSFDDAWDKAFEFRYPEIPEAPKAKDYDDDSKYQKDLKEFNEITLPNWKNTHLKPFKHFAQWVYDTRWCDVYGEKLSELTDEEAERRKTKFATEKWDHLDVWKVAAYYIYVMRFGAVDQIVKNSMLTSEGPFAYNEKGVEYGVWDNTNINSDLYGRYYKWYFINYDNDTIMGVKNDGSLVHGPEITRQSLEEGKDVMAYAGWDSTLWNNIENDEEFQKIIRITDQGISKTLTYQKAINTFDVDQVGKWCERIYNRDADYKYITPYKGGWTYSGNTDEVFSDKLFMLQGSRTAHRRWWLSRRFNLLDGKWSSGDFATKYVEVKCDYGTIGDTFGAVAGANAYFGYQINNKTFKVNEGEDPWMGGETFEFKSNDNISWKLYKKIQIGDPIAIYGSADMVELNLQGISKYLSSVAFKFGTNNDLGNKLERFILGIPEHELMANSFYKSFADDKEKSGFDKIKEEYPLYITSASDFGNDGDAKYPMSDTELNAEDVNSPMFYCIKLTNEGGVDTYTYFAKVNSGIRNYSCKDISFVSLDKLQTLNMMGYMALSTLDLTFNKFINDVDVRYSSVPNVKFCNGSRIKSFKASDKLIDLTFTNCNNITLSDIYINSNSLKNDGGKNIEIINIDNSNGLNHKNDFRDFILKWMKNGDVTVKKLSLKGIKWSGVKVSDIETIKRFCMGDENGLRASECTISGIIEIGNEKLLSSDLAMFEELNKSVGGGLTFRIPYANIILNAIKNDIIAGETAEYTYNLFPNAETIKEGNGIIEAFFVKEVNEEDSTTIKDIRTNKIYKPILNDDVREGITININEDTYVVNVITTENIAGGDSNAILMIKLTYDGNAKFDIANITIKEPTYAIGGSINGVRNIGEKNTTYLYTLSLVSNKNNEPIGSMDITWNIESEEENFEKYFINHYPSEDKRTFTIITSENQPDPVSGLKIKAVVENHSSVIDLGLDKIITIEKDILLLNENVVLTKDTNPVVFDLCKAQGWVENDIVMTKAEAEAIEDIGYVFSNVKDEKWAFEEFKYFRNANLTSIENEAFANSYITSIIFPENITKIGNNAFSNCSELETVQLNNTINEIPSYAFYKCSKLKNFILTDNITTIKEYAFGGTNIEYIVSEKTTHINDKYILITTNSSLKTIENNAFEISQWSPSTTTNNLKVITLPKTVGFNRNSYNFLLSQYLREIVIIDEVDSRFILKDNILFADRGETIIVRAIPYSDNVIEDLFLETVVEVYDYAFYNCKNIKNITIGREIANYGLGKGAFNRSSIESIDFSNCDNFDSIQDYTFYGCDKLSNILYPTSENFKILGKEVFVGCDSLNEIILPDNIKIIGDQLIVSCSTLTKVILPKFITDLSHNIIHNCPELEEIKLPIFSYTDNNGNVVVLNTNISSNISTNCNKSYVTLNEEDDNKCIKLIDGCLYKIGENDGNNGVREIEQTLVYISDKIVTLNVDENTKIIGSNLITGATKNVENIYCNENLHTIQNNAFGSYYDEKCEIKTITLPSTLKSIGEKAFYYSTNLTEIIIPNLVTTIPKSLFVGCTELRKVMILGELSLINQFAFSQCSNLATIIILSSNAPIIDTGSQLSWHPFFNVGTNVNTDKKLYTAYKAKGYDLDGWKNPLINDYNFSIEDFTLEDDVLVRIYDENGEELTDDTLYFVSESGHFVFSNGEDIMSSTYNTNEGGYKLIFNNNVYHNENISVYAEKDYNADNYIGKFTAKYNVINYEVGKPSVILSRGIFSSGLFGYSRNVETVEDEIVNITKSEYESLISKVNQLYEIINKLKK